MRTDIDATLDATAERTDWKRGEIRTKVFRHTHCAARLQALDDRASVSEYTVAREPGHGGFALVRRVYGDLGRVRHRSEVVEYRVEQFVDQWSVGNATRTFAPERSSVRGDDTTSDAKPSHFTAQNP
jgi:hypothetical protein